MAAITEKLSGLVNGHHENNAAASSSGPSLPARAEQALAASEAMALLESYTRGDGLSVAELMDSRKNGGLTYNDFLMLPGHISFPASIVSLQTRLVELFSDLLNQHIPLVQAEHVLIRSGSPGTSCSTRPSSLRPWTPSPRTGKLAF